MAGARRKKTAAGRALTPPPATPETIHPTFVTIAAGTYLLRIYSPAPYNTQALTFRDVGPLNRFDHQRAAAGGGGAQRDPGRGIMYAAESFECCIGERFTDEGSITLSGNRVARLQVKKGLKLVDLRGLAATGVGTIQAVSSDGDRALTQAWGRYLYEHPDLADSDGLIFTSATTGKPSIALWERAEGKLACAAGDDWELLDPVVTPDINVAAYELHLLVSP